MIVLAAIGLACRDRPRRSARSTSRKPSPKFSRSVRLRNTPSVWRSSETKPMPAWRNAPGLSPDIARVADAYLAGVAAVDAGGGANELALALAFDAGEPDDFAGMRPRDRPDRSRGRSARDRKQRRPDASSPWRGKSGRADGLRSAPRSRSSVIDCAGRLSMISPSRITEMRSASSSTSCSRCET